MGAAVLFHILMTLFLSDIPFIAVLKIVLKLF